MRRSAIVVFPEGEALTAVDGLRRRFDPLAQLIPAHITLVFPFVDDLGPSQLVAHLRQAVEHRPPFDTHFEGADIDVEGEYLLLPARAGREELTDLHERLYRGPLAIHRSRAHVYQPHITIGRIADEAARTSALALARAQLPAFHASIRDLAVFRLESASAGFVELRVPLPPA